MFQGADKQDIDYERRFYDKEYYAFAKITNRGRNKKQNYGF